MSSVAGLPRRALLRRVAVISTRAEAAREAARRFGTPLYLYDLPRLHADAEAVARAFPDPWLRLYSLKANGLPGLLRGLPERGFGASAVSSGELALAARAGFPVARTALEGVGKSGIDLARAVDLAAAGTPLLWVSIESAAEAAALASLVRERGGMRRPSGAQASGGFRLDVLVRINPGTRPETRRGWAVSGSESKFGILPEELPELVAAGGGPAGPLRWRGIDVHIGSQLGAVDAWRSAFRLGLRLLTLQRANLPEFDTLDAGSGFPVDYGRSGAVPSPARFAEEAGAELVALPPGAAPARLAVEPGRSVAAACGLLVASVLHVRERARRIVVLDAGMTELVRPALYGADHPIGALTSMGRPVDWIDAGWPGGAAAGDERSAPGELWNAATEGPGAEGQGAMPVALPGVRALAGPGAATDLSIVGVDGPICELTDHLGVAELPPLRRNDLLAIGVAGAYASSMASTYNGRPRPVEVAWDGSRLFLLRRRGTLAALP